MEPIINEIKNLFSKINSLEKKTESIFDKIQLLVPYKNNGLEFYINELYSVSIMSQSYIVFGHDLGGYYGINENNGTVYKLYGHVQAIKIMFCNSDFDKFICFNNLFTNWISKRICDEIAEESTERYSDVLQSIYKNIDEVALSDENNYWSITVYEISEDFFPLNDARLKFIKEFLARENF